jgi:hypothetical protein
MSLQVPDEVHLQVVEYIDSAKVQFESGLSASVDVEQPVGIGCGKLDVLE